MKKTKHSWHWVAYCGLALAVGGCLLRITSRTVALAQSLPEPSPTVVVLPTATAMPLPTHPPTPTSSPTATSIPPTPTLTPTATLDPASNAALCAHYAQFPRDWLSNVNRDIALPHDYAPDDLAIVPLAQQNVVYREIPARQALHQPLLDLVAAMNQASLSVMVASGFRSFSDQQLAYDKWQALYPDRAPEISAVPGHSEHQLGTSVDFTTPYMDDLYGDQFHIRFADTPEGLWLSQQAAYYGFILSYPKDATATTGYAWEPWHYRYVGALALELKARAMTLTEYIGRCGPDNIIPTATPSP